MSRQRSVESPAMSPFFNSPSKKVGEEAKSKINDDLKEQLLEDNEGQVVRPTLPTVKSTSSDELL